MSEKTRTVGTVVEAVIGVLAISLLVPFIILLVGLPVVAVVRLIAEIVSWAAAALG